MTLQPPQTAPAERLLVLEAGRAERYYWRDLWTYRELFAILAWRDLAVRYKQTVIGVAWAVIRPLLTVAIFTVVFGRLAKLQSDGAAPYALMVFAGMLPWTLFSTILSEASGSLIGQRQSRSEKSTFHVIIIPSASIGGRRPRRFRRSMLACCSSGMIPLVSASCRAGRFLTVARSSLRWLCWRALARLCSSPRST